MQMTPQVLVQACRDNGGYKQPRLNDQLYLQCRGFCEIANLQPYTELKALWLEQNAIQTIEGLEGLEKLASLFLQSNAIRSIGSGLQSLTNLRTLNLSNNYIAKVTGLRQCVLLETVQLANNRIETLEDIEELASLPELSCVDISNNRIDEKPEGSPDDYLVQFFARFPALTVLYLQGQELPRRMKNYRKSMICGIKQLTYLDERPIFPQERRAVEAWGSGGADAEREELAKIRQERIDDLTACLRTQEAMKERGRAVKEQKEAAYQEQLAAEKAWRQERKLVFTAKMTELDHLEYENRGLLELQEEREVEEVLLRRALESKKAAQQAEADRVAAAEAERERLAHEAAEKAKRQTKFDEMRYWVREFANEDVGEDDATRQRELDDLLEMLQASYLHAVPTDGEPSASAPGTASFGTGGGSATGSHVDGLDDADRSSVTSAGSAGKRGKARAAKRWAASAARFERFYKMEQQAQGQPQQQ